jgi:hypothetical protein
VSPPLFWNHLLLLLLLCHTNMGISYFSITHHLNMNILVRRGREKRVHSIHPSLLIEISFSSRYSSVESVYFLTSSAIDDCSLVASFRLGLLQIICDLPRSVNHDHPIVIESYTKLRSEDNKRETTHFERYHQQSQQHQSRASPLD